MDTGVESTLTHMLNIRSKIERLWDSLNDCQQQLLAAAQRGSITPDDYLEIDQQRRQNRIGWTVDIPRAMAWDRYDLMRAQVRAAVIASCVRQVNRDNQPGPHAVYWLMQDPADVVYVGRSKDVISRVWSHRQSKDFDSWDWIDCDSAHEQADLEAILIDQHKPILNKRREKRNGAAV